MKRAYEKVARTWERGTGEETTAMERKKDKDKKNKIVREKRKSSKMCRSACMQVAKSIIDFSL